uniref:Uncharacterized protein n=1 Tax=Melanthalia intermedia TaxID=172989 RepID=A0A345UB16_9FLOR|nr:hypothetical protein [Melanthalia intermedia]AXI97652.1 hypothetical protein [Melanthalia intermedia]
MNNNIVSSSDSVIQKEVDKITASIQNSTQHLGQYFQYISGSAIGKSSSEDDWNFCTLILKYISLDNQSERIILILKHFLYRNRYRSKFDQHRNYLTMTIKKAVFFSVKQELIGSCLNNDHDNGKMESTLTTSDLSPSSYPSINRSDVLEVCNLFNIFYFNSSKSATKNFTYENCNNSNNLLKVQEQCMCFRKPIQSFLCIDFSKQAPITISDSLYLNF